MPTESGISEEEWKEAEEYFFNTLRQYRGLMLDENVRKNVNTQFAWWAVFYPLLRRWYDGEDTIELLHDMLGVQ